MKLTKYLLLTFCFLISVSCVWAGTPESPDRYTVFFDSYSSTPKMDSLNTLESIKSKLAGAPPPRIVISGHAASNENQPGTKDPKAYKSNLSEMRAQYVSRWLSSGIKTPLNIETSGYGDARPVGNNATPKGSNANRRVDVLVYHGAAMNDGKKPVVTIPERTHIFEEVLEDTKVVHDFVIKNTGDAELNILKVKPG